MVLSAPPASKAPQPAAAGFSLIELMIAMVVLAVGLLAGLGMIVAAIATNAGPKTNTAAAALAESVLEKIMAVQLNADGTSAPTSLTDCAGNSFTINTTPGPGSSPPISFQQTPVPGYSMQYVNCAAGQGLTYDIRWTIEPGPTLSTPTQVVTVSARALGANTGPSAPFVHPVTLRTLRGGS